MTSIGASLLQRHGVSHVVNLIGGYGEWLRAGYPTAQPEAEGSEK